MVDLFNLTRVDGSKGEWSYDIWATVSVLYYLLVDGGEMRKNWGEKRKRGI